MSDGNSRKELDNIATALGLHVSEHSNKRVLAQAILVVREQREAMDKQRQSGSFHAEEVSEVKKLSMNSVKDMMKATKEMANEIKAFYDGAFKQGMKAFQDAVNSFNQSINAQKKENNDFVKNEFQQNLKAFRQTIELFRQSITDQMKENQRFARQFYG